MILQPLMPQADTRESHRSVTHIPVVPVGDVSGCTCNRVIHAAATMASAASAISECEFVIQIYSPQQ